MEKLTGHGRPHSHFAGEVGQHYEDLDTGDIYECRISSQYSPTHGWPVGGYVWERRAKGEDIQELFGSGSGGSVSWNDIVDKPFGESPLSVTTAFTYNSGTYSYSADTDIIPPFPIDDTTIKVKWDGVEYETKVNTYTMGHNSELVCYYIGHVGFYDYRTGYDNAPIPFMWQWGGTANVSRLYCADASVHTIELPATIVNKIDKKFLMDSTVFITDEGASYGSAYVLPNAPEDFNTKVTATAEDVARALFNGSTVLYTSVVDGGNTVFSNIDQFTVMCIPDTSKVIQITCNYMKGSDQKYLMIY